MAEQHFMDEEDLKAFLAKVSEVAVPKPDALNKHMQKEG